MSMKTKKEIPSKTGIAPSILRLRVFILLEQRN